MGLVIDINNRSIGDAISIATEGVTTSYGEVSSGRDETADRKICKMLDKGKVLAAVDRLPSHLSGWLLVAYAAPGYISDRRAQEFYDVVLSEFVGRYGDAGFKLSEDRWDAFIRLIPLICNDVARHGTDVDAQYRPAEYIAVLAADTGLDASVLRKGWRRDWAPAIEFVKSILDGWDALAKQKFRQELATFHMA
ncbi:Uncharacterised protein [Plesiomonas shigelloides]|uniref:hypothetical protein n=2 Tax=Plesiomonas shigelloides TaxID=703 RepID=UPI0007EDEB58|nr:hypothetical protein [Plesiomonas shigelloides]SBT60187.1 Uncharacterised protein [Plesiomonas shigelloides]